MNDERIHNLTRGFQVSRVLLTANELGIFTELDDVAKSSLEVAQALGTDPRATDRLMNALVTLGLLEKSPEGFRNSPESAEYLVPGKPNYMGGALGHTNHLWDTWSTLTEAVRQGTTQVHREGIMGGAVHSRYALQCRR